MIVGSLLMQPLSSHRNVIFGQEDESSKPPLDLLMSPNTSKPASVMTDKDLHALLQSLPPHWSYDAATRVLLGRFDPTKPFDAKHLSVFLDLKDVAVVTEGLVKLKAPKLGVEFVGSFLANNTKRCLICFESSIKEGQVVTVELSERIYLTGSKYLEYLKKRKDLLDHEGSIQAAIASQDD